MASLIFALELQNASDAIAAPTSESNPRKYLEFICCLCRNHRSIYRQFNGPVSLITSVAGGREISFDTCYWRWRLNELSSRVLETGKPQKSARFYIASSRFVYGTPITLTASERFFSTTGIIRQQNRSRLSATSAETILKVGHFMRSDENNEKQSVSRAFRG